MNKRLIVGLVMLGAGTIGWTVTATLKLSAGPSPMLVGFGMALTASALNKKE